MNAHHYIVSVASKVEASSDSESVRNLGRVIELAELALDYCVTFDRDQEPTVMTSVAPMGVMVAIREAAPDTSKRFVEALRQTAEGFGKIGLAVAVTSGALHPVRTDWISDNFEGSPAIAAARLLSRISAGELAFHVPGQTERNIRRSWGTLGRAAVTKTVPGKHPGEEFETQIVEGVFPLAPSPLDESQVASVPHALVVARSPSAEVARAQYVNRFIKSMEEFSVEHYIKLPIQWQREILLPNEDNGQAGAENTTILSKLSNLEQEIPAILIGGPGAGKTTVLVEYLRSLASEIDEKLPVFVPLALFRPGRSLESLLDLREFTSAQQARLLEGGLAVVLDGVNEARCQVVDDVFQELIEFCQRYPNNQYFLSCRSAEFPPWVRAYVNELHLLPVTEEQVREQFGSVLGDELGQEVLQHLSSREAEWLHFRDLCANPLLLTMVLTLVRDEGVPSIGGVGSKSALYSAFLEGLYEWESAKPKDSDWRRVLPVGLRDEFLSAIARRMQAAEAVATDERVVQGWISEILGRESVARWWSMEQRPGVDELTRAILARPPFRVVEDRPGCLKQFAFLHQSFGEYFAAVHYTKALSNEEDAWGLVKPLVTDKSRRQWEVVEFVAGLVEDAKELITTITRWASEEREQAYLILAARCVRAGAEVPEEVADDIRIRMIDAFKNWGRPFDYELVHAMAEALSEVGRSFPQRLRDDFERFTSKYSHVRPAELRAATSSTLRQLCKTGGSRARDAAYTLGRRLWPNDERRLIAEFLVEAIEGSETDVREQMIIALKELAHPVSIPRLIQVIEDPAEGSRAKAFALNALGAIGQLDTVNVVIDYLRDLGNQYRDSASWSLQMLGREARKKDGQVFDTIKRVYFECLLSETDDIEGRYSKGNIVYSLGCLRAREFTADVIEWLQGEQDTYVIEDGVQALGLLGDHHASEVLCNFFAHRDPVVRAKAAEASGRLRDLAARSKLRNLLEDDYPIVKDAAHDALAQLDGGTN